MIGEPGLMNSIAKVVVVLTVLGGIRTIVHFAKWNVKTKKGLIITAIGVVAVVVIAYLMTQAWI